MAAEVVEAIDDPGLQRQRGWDLSRWRYHLVPWGVRFSYHDPHSGGQTDVLALMAFSPGPGMERRDGDGGHAVRSFA